MLDSAPDSLLPGLLDLPQSDAPASSGASTPPLWHTSPPDSPLRIPTSYLSLSPASRTQAILRGQRELMDLVRNLPESSYELSLKDLVDLSPPPTILEADKRPSIDGDRNRVAESYRRRGSGYGNRMLGQQQQQQEGLLLKMVFPVYMGAAAAKGRRAGSGRRQRKERSEEESSATEESWRKRDGDSESGDSLFSSTVGGSGKSSWSSSGSSRSNSANNTTCNSVIAVR